jgi:hypothetical protein
MLKHSDGSDDYSRVLNLLFDADPFDSMDAIKRIPEHERGRASAEALADRYLRPAYAAHEAQVLAKFETLWREAVAFVVEKWPHIQAVSDALWRKRPRTLSGEEATEIIERIEERIRSYPPSVQDALKRLRSVDEERLK